MVEQPRASESASYHHRELAESFGSNADLYDRARPRYPRDLANVILAGAPGTRVLDVGIGTGISALPFRDAGADILGVEIDPRMAAIARSRGFEVEIARFEEWDAGAFICDLVIAGQSWHWIDPLGGALKAADILVTGGRIAPFWNVGEPEPDIATAFGEIYRSIDTGLPFTPWSSERSALDGYENFLASTEAGIRETALFSEPRRVAMKWSRPIDTACWLDQVPTMGGHNRIAPKVLAALLEGMADVIDSRGGSFTMNYTTVAIVAEKG